MNSPAIFDRAGQELRVVLDDQGEPLFVAADVAAMLGYEHTPHLTRSLDDDEKGVRPVDTPGGVQNLSVITEAGLYRAIVQRQTGRMTSDRARGQVKAFQRWVTHEVLPTIRRTGTYTAPARELSRLELIEIARDAELGRLAAEERIAELAPAAEAWETVTTAAGADYSVAEAAQTLANSGWPIGQRRLFLFLADQRWILRTEGHWRPYQRVIDQGLMASRLRPPFMNRATGELQAAAPQPRITAKGIERLLAIHQEQTGQLALHTLNEEDHS